MANVGKDWIDHATEENYDNWYNGSGLEESLRDKVFNIRTGVALPTSYGTQGVNGIANSAWGSVSGIVPGPATIGLDTLARAALHASTFETAFHDNTSNDLSKFSTGAYIYPDTTYQNLAGFSKTSQAHTRDAAIFARVNTWAQAAANGNYTGTSVSEQADLDLDGENEYLLYNDRFFASFRAARRPYDCSLAARHQHRLCHTSGRHPGQLCRLRDGRRGNGQHHRRRGRGLSHFMFQGLVRQDR